MEAEEGGEDTVALALAPSVTLSWTGSFVVPAVAVHCVLLLGWRGMSGGSILAGLLLVWIASRYLYVRACVMLGMPRILLVPRFRPRYLPVAAETRCKKAMEHMLRFVVRASSWRQPLFSGAVVVACGLLACIFNQLALTTALYIFYVVAVALFNSSLLQGAATAEKTS